MQYVLMILLGPLYFVRKSPLLSLWLLFLIALLTVLTQVGGVVLWLSLPLLGWIRNKTEVTRRRFLVFTGGFLALYLACTLFIIPPVAKVFGRVPLPLVASSSVPFAPMHLQTCLLNRHYVRPELKEVANEAAVALNEKYPETKSYYLDANFPFYNGFPLLPHLSHSDGKKLDIAFSYQNESGEHQPGKSPSWFGYGVYETPFEGESNQPEVCRQRDHWMYNFLYSPLRQRFKTLELEPKRTKELLKIYDRDPRIGKIFLEPHLKSRMGLGGYGKIRYHGCHSTRHDDHFHVQL